MSVENANFSVPEIRDLQAGVTSLSAFGDFSTIGFTMVGLGEPRSVRAGVVGGSYFEVMGLQAAIGRLLGPGDDGPKADGAAVLTYRFRLRVFAVTQIAASFVLVAGAGILITTLFALQRHQDATSTTAIATMANALSSSVRASRSGCSRAWTPSIAG